MWNASRGDKVHDEVDVKLPCNENKDDIGMKVQDGVGEKSVRWNVPSAECPVLNEL